MEALKSLGQSSCSKWKLQIYRRSFKRALFSFAVVINQINVNFIKSEFAATTVACQPNMQQWIHSSPQLIFPLIAYQWRPKIEYNRKLKKWHTKQSQQQTTIMICDTLAKKFNKCLSSVDNGYRLSRFLRQSRTNINKATPDRISWTQLLIYCSLSFIVFN